MESHLGDTCHPPRLALHVVVFVLTVAALTGLHYLAHREMPHRSFLTAGVHSKEETIDTPKM